MNRSEKPVGNRDGAVEVANYAEQAAILVSEGVEMLFVEMVWFRDHGLRMIEALEDCPIPIFVGMMVPAVDEHGTPMLRLADTREGRVAFGVEHEGGKEVAEQTTAGGIGISEDQMKEPGWDFKDAVTDLTRLENVVGLNIHHTSVADTLPSLKAAREAGWTGALGAYPDYGEWLRISWQTPVPLGT